jgi:hypothetical protein
VLDPYPVGTHTQILEALFEGIPIVSAPKLQECTNSHAIGIVSALGKIDRISFSYIKFSYLNYYFCHVVLI